MAETGGGVYVAVDMEHLEKTIDENIKEMTGSYKRYERYETFWKFSQIKVSK